MRFLFSLLYITTAITLAAMPACAQQPEQHVVSHKPDSVALTVYRDDLALISETRTIVLPPGKSTISFEGVSNGIISQSVLLREFSGFTLERNFDYDLLSPYALFESAIGEKVLRTITNPGTGAVEHVEATIVSAGQGVVLEVDGKYEALQCSGLPERTSFDGVPDRLKPAPTLSIDVSSLTGGPQTIVISYLADGYGWQADYILDVHDTGNTGSLIGWLTMENETAVSIENAPTAIIAGSLQRLHDTKSEDVHSPSFSAACWPMGSTKDIPENKPVIYRQEQDDVIMLTAQRRKSFDAPEMMVMAEMAAPAPPEAQLEEFGDYKLYRTPTDITLAAYQTKQIMFLNKETVDLEKYHVFEMGGSWEIEQLPAPRNSTQEDQYFPSTVEYRIDNAKDGKLAKPLPEGTMRVMTKSATGQQYFLGEDDVRDLAIDLPVRVKSGNSNDVLRQSKLIERHRGKDKNWAIVEHTFSNASPQRVKIEHSIGNNSRQVLKVSKQSKSLTKEPGVPKWRFSLAGESSTTLRYKVSW